MNKITLLFTIIIGVIQFTSAQTFTAGSYKYRVIKDGVSVAAASQKLFGNVIIPEAVNFGDKNYKVTAVADSGFRNCAGIKNLILPASITKIGKAAFWGCESLKSIIIPNSITELEPEVFSECAISQISIPNTITKNKLSITLITPDVSRQISGVRVLPRLRKIADAKSYSKITGIPAI